MNTVTQSNNHRIIVRFFTYLITFSLFFFSLDESYGVEEHDKVKQKLKCEVSELKLQKNDPKSLLAFQDENFRHISVASNSNPLKAVVSSSDENIDFYMGIDTPSGPIWTAITLRDSSGHRWAMNALWSSP